MGNFCCELCGHIDTHDKFSKIPHHYVGEIAQEFNVKYELFKNHYFICEECLNQLKESNPIKIEQYLNQLRIKMNNKINMPV